jgi:hypothetical protein
MKTITDHQLELLMTWCLFYLLTLNLPASTLAVIAPFRILGSEHLSDVASFPYKAEAISFVSNHFDNISQIVIHMLYAEYTFILSINFAALL